MNALDGEYELKKLDAERRLHEINYEIYPHFQIGSNHYLNTHTINKLLMHSRTNMGKKVRSRRHLTGISAAVGDHNRAPRDRQWVGATLNLNE